jgi:hypothetical protein
MERTRCLRSLVARAYRTDGGSRPFAPETRAATRGEVIVPGARQSEPRRCTRPLRIPFRLPALSTTTAAWAKRPPQSDRRLHPIEQDAPTSPSLRLLHPHHGLRALDVTEKLPLCLEVRPRPKPPIQAQSWPQPCAPATKGLTPGGSRSGSTPTGAGYNSAFFPHPEDTSLLTTPLGDEPRDNHYP